MKTATATINATDKLTVTVEDDAGYIECHVDVWPGTWEADAWVENQPYDAYIRDLIRRRYGIWFTLTCPGTYARVGGMEQYTISGPVEE
jgi:hypothetical protein